jgi:hypothetical protein
MLPEKFEFLPQHRRVLQDLVIDQDGPGTILHDFEATLAFLKGRNLPLTGRHQLPLRVLPEINALLARPLQLGLKRPQQKSYPHIHGLYLLVRASGLTFVGQTPKKPLLIVDDEVYQAWTGLNLTERYYSLLEVWLLRGRPEIVGEGRSAWFSTLDAFSKWGNFFLRIPDEGQRVAGDQEAESWLRYSPGWHNLGLLELFGLVSVQHGPLVPGKGWRIERIRRTLLGDALLALLNEGFFGDLDKITKLDVQGKVPSGALQPTLQPYFPAWQETLRVPEWAFREGTHVFRVSLGATWRRIAIPASASLDALASVILNAFEFDHDHLYQFSYQNRFGVWEHVNHPYLEDGPWTSEVQIGDVPLGLGQTMTYLFDFGDQWKFDVTLERVDPPDAALPVPTAPAILEARGQPPEQYPMWDDWE